MQLLHFESLIHATPEQLWNCLWNPEHYRVWTASFSQGSYYECKEFKPGGRIHFLIPSGSGMYSVIDTLETNKRITFRHLGEIKAFREMPPEDGRPLWEDALESYELIPQDPGTLLRVSANTLEDYVEYMNKTFPLALQTLKTIAETKNSSI